MFPKLEGLDSLARRDGVDIRPTLVRVLTDLYVQKPAHSSEEERHYTELVLRLIDTVDLGTRGRSRRRSRALRALRRRSHGGWGVTSSRSRSRSCAIAGADLRRTRFYHPRLRLEPRRDHRDQTRGYVRPTRARPWRSNPTQARRAPRRPDAPGIPELGLAELFFSADSAARRMLLASLGGVEPEVPQSVQPVETNPGARGQRRSRRDRAVFTRLLEGALGLSREQAERIIGDKSGEPLLVAAKALAMPRSRCSAC